MRVARIAASTHGVLGPVEPEKVAESSLGDGLDDDRGPLLAVIELDDPKLVIAAGIEQDLARDDVGRPRVGHRKRGRADGRLGQEQHVVGDVEDALAARLEVVIGRRRAERTQHEPRHAQVGVDLAVPSARC